MVTAYFNGWTRVIVYGLTQWDYGQDIAIKADIEIPDGTEVQFYQGDLSSAGETRAGIVRLPDTMLQYDAPITAYVYVRGSDSGETILTMVLKIAARPKPENYILPEYEGYARLLPEGGDAGQVPRRTETGVAWGDAADDLTLTDYVLQLTSGGKPIGTRVRLPSGTGDGREIELRNNGTAIQWRYTDSNDWTDLVQLTELQGPAGETPEFEIRDGHLYAIYKED